MTARGVGDRLRGLSRVRRWALLAAVVWLVLIGSYAIGFFGAAGGGATFLDGLLFLTTLVLPLVLGALAVRLAEEIERQREVMAALAELVPPLIGALDGTREALERHAPAPPPEIGPAVAAAVARSAGLSQAQVDRLLAGQAELRTTLAAILAESRRRPASAPAGAPPTSRPAAPAPAPAPSPDPAPAPRPAPPAPEADAALPLLPGAEDASGPDWPTLIRALDFPRDADDRPGFEALKTALRHHGLAQMLQAAEDVLTLLSQAGIYMDDLRPEPGDPDAWRRFMAGVRGAEVARVGAIRDEAALETARRLTKTDPIFRDTALFFQRRFDRILGEFAADADDAAIMELADTRSARAFMLLGRLSGMFG